MFDGIRIGYDYLSAGCGLTARSIIRPAPLYIFIIAESDLPSRRTQIALERFAVGAGADGGATGDPSVGASDADGESRTHHSHLCRARRSVELQAAARSAGMRAAGRRVYVKVRWQ